MKKNKYLIVFVALILANSCSKKDKIETKPTTLTDVDGNVYQIVTLGTRVWMAENLKTTKFKDGTRILYIADSIKWANLNTHAYCYYNNDSISNKNKYGAIYNWYTINTQNLCPKGWHVSTVEELGTLSIFVGGFNQYGKLKETGITNWLNPNIGATNELAFTALPGGERTMYGSFSSIGIQACWWLSDQFSVATAQTWYLSNSSADIVETFRNKKTGFSVRCVQDY